MALSKDCFGMCAQLKASKIQILLRNNNEMFFTQLFSKKIREKKSQID